MTTLTAEQKSQIISWLENLQDGDTIKFEDGYVSISNNGITSKHYALVLYSGDREKCYEDAKTVGRLDEALYLVKRELYGRKSYYAEPLDYPKDKWQMLGGNFVYTSDANFAEMCDGRQPIPVFDRYETQEQYDALSRN